MTGPLTFGVEFEFALATLDERGDDRHSYDSRPVPRVSSFVRDPEPGHLLSTRSHLERQQADTVKNHIAKTLKGIGLLVQTSYVDSRLRATEGSVDLTAKWLVTDDPSVEPPNLGHSQDEQYKWQSIEVSSPVYYFTPVALLAVQHVINTLKSNYRININESAGLHVHVGRGGQGFDLWTVKNMMSFLWCFEPQIDTLHPAHRLKNRYCLSVRRDSPLSRGCFGITYMAKYWTSKPDLPSIHALAKIFEAKNMEDLFSLIQVVTNSAYNINNLRSASDKKTKRTVEFRQHEATLDIERVLQWIETTVGLVNFAQGCDPAALMELLINKAIDDDDEGKEDQMRVAELFKIIGLDGPSDYYHNRLTEALDAK